MITVCSPHIALIATVGFFMHKIEIKAALREGKRRMVVVY